MSSVFRRIVPGQAVPSLVVPLVGGGTFDIGGARDARLLIVFYRGVHCPQCRRQLIDLESKLEDFKKRGTSTLAVSCDTVDRAAEAKADWGLSRLTVGYSLTLDVARRWGLFVSRSRGQSSTGHQEPALFTEPGLFIIQFDNTLYSSSIQTSPFARPKFEDILSALDLIDKTGYPARGDVE